MSNAAAAADAAEANAAGLRLSIDIPRPKYRLVDSTRAFEDLLRSVSNTHKLSFDYETSANVNDNYMRITEKQRPLDLPRSTITSASFRTSDGFCYYLSVDHLNSFNMPKEAVKDVLLAKPKAAPTCAHNMGFEWYITKNCLDLDLREIGPLRDTMMAAKVLDSAQAVGLKDLTRRKLGILQESYKAVTNGLNMNEITAQQACHYGCDDSEYQWQLEDLMDKELKDTGMWQYYTDLEMPIVPIIAEMSMYGAWINPDILEKKTAEHLDQMAIYSGKIYDALGYEPNLSSPVQMGRVLYGTGQGQLGLPMPPYADSQSATDKESLYWNRDLHPIVELFLTYKKFETRRKLYDKPYVNLIHPDTRMMHSQLRQAVTDTSRFSSSSPNLQQLAKRGDGIEVRELFEAPEHLGYDLIMAYDMSQVELVLAAHRSRSKELIASYGRVRGDVHTKTTCALFGITAEEAKTNKLYRQAGKTANFSLLYGGQAKRIFRLIKLELAKMGMPCPFTIRDVEQMIIKYFGLYPEIREMQKNDVLYARENGYVKSLFGRRFYLPDIYSKNSYIRSKAERKASNSPIQGTCAELLKRAMIAIDKERIPKEDLRMFASIHDENVYYTRKACLRDVSHIVHKHMSNTPEGLRAFMESEGTVGKNFGALKDIDKQMEAWGI